VRTLKDPTGKNFGNALYAAAEKPEGQIDEVGPDLFPKPGTTEPVVEKFKLCCEGWRSGLRRRLLQVGRPNKCALFERCRYILE
jgi:hypothetical protein